MHIEFVCMIIHRVGMYIVGMYVHRVGMYIVGMYNTKSWYVCI